MSPSRLRGPKRRPRDEYLEDTQREEADRGARDSFTSPTHTPARDVRAEEPAWELPTSVDSEGRGDDLER
jgi:hypothetical protein